MDNHKLVKGHRGRKPKRLNTEGVDWKDALGHALKKPKPEEGWDKVQADDSENEDGQSS